VDKNWEARERLANLCKDVYDKNMVSGSGGNISIKIEDTVYITPSGYSLGNIAPEELVEVSLNGDIKGTIRPSKELFLHMESYRARPDINAVVHVHSHYSILIGIMLDKNTRIPPYTPGYAMRVRHMGFVPFFVPGSRELAQGISQEIKQSNVVLMKNHGMVVVGKNVQEAFNVAEEVEENAKMHIELKGQGALSEQQVKAILEKYK
jgi:ribulose-5-phosphate 4-epimerase/fuculose-1-phosphate aldolase